MRDHSAHIELTRDAAVAAILSQPLWGGAAPVEVVRIEKALGRVLAEDVASRIDAPNCLTCNMDSIAVHWDDVEAGLWSEGAVHPRGERWQFANTGVAMPEGFDTAIAVEQVRFSDDAESASLAELPLQRFAGTSQPGSKLKAGDITAKAGTEVSPLLAASIKAGNVSSVSVRRKPQVAFIPTGNELCGGNGQIQLGKNIETNSLLFAGKVERWGGSPVVFDIVADKRDLIQQAVRRGLDCADIVVVNGGSSKGSDDWCVEVVDEMGQMICHQMAHGPGRHSWLAVVEGKPVVGVSGPPAGAEFALQFYVLPLIRAYLGLEAAPKRFRARLSQEFPKPPHRGPRGVKKPPKRGPHEPGGPGKGFCTVRLVNVEVGEDGVVQATPVAGRLGSAEAQSANAVCMVPVGPDNEPHEGDFIEVEFRQ